MIVINMFIRVKFLTVINVLRGEYATASSASLNVAKPQDNKHT